MIVDVNTWVGHWPFRALPRRSAADLLRQMDRHGIDRALVASLHGLFYKDAHEANHELARELKRHRDRLVPCAVINPVYYGWQDDLRQCREAFGMSVVRLAPDYHGYALGDPCAAELVAQASGLDLAVALDGRVVDPRGRHRLDPGRELDADAVVALVRRHPGATYLMLNFARVLPDPAVAACRCCYDITRFLGRNGLRLEREIKTHGAEHFVFGTSMLLRYGKPACLALAKCRLTARERQAIESGNIAGLVPALTE